MFRIALLLVLLCASSAPAQIYLQLAGSSQGPIPGDGTNPDLPNAIEVDSFQWGAGRAFGPGGTQPSALSVSDVTISKQQDRSSLPIIQANGEGERMGTCRFYFFTGSATAVPDDEALSRRMPLPGEYLQIELIGAYISSYSTSAAPDGSQGESVGFTFESIRVLDASTGEVFIYDRNTPAREALAREAMPLPRVKVPGVFDFEITDAGRIDVEIVDERGHPVTRLFGDASARADGVLRWDATDDQGRPVAPGVYTATVRTAEVETTRRIVIGD